jgi:hypothetical protein
MQFTYRGHYGLGFFEAGVMDRIIYRFGFLFPWILYDHCMVDTVLGRADKNPCVVIESRLDPCRKANDAG